jgi:hypothetical protein
VGEIEMLPDAPNVPATPEIVTEVAFGTFHVSVEAPPGEIVVGDALKVELATVGQAVTLTLVVRLIEEHAPAPAAVKV